MTTTEAARYPNRKASTLELPDFCGPLGNLNQMCICRRATLTFDEALPDCTCGE